MKLISKKWADVLFEGRNKAYGAYRLRATSSRRHLFSFFLVLIMVIIAVFTPKAIDFVKSFFYNGSEYNQLKTAMPPQIKMEESLDFKSYVENQQFSKTPPIVSTITGETSNIENYIELDDTYDLTDEKLEEQLKKLELKKIENADEMLENFEPDEIYLVVDVLPQFPGGKSALLKYITTNIIYPQEAQRKGIKGRVLCEFVVEKDGAINHIKVVESIDTLLDNEAIRLLQTMPRWSPAVRLGQNVRVKYHIPFNFDI